MEEFNKKSDKETEEEIKEEVKEEIRDDIKGYVLKYERYNLTEAEVFEKLLNVDPDFSKVDFILT